MIAHLPRLIVASIVAVMLAAPTAARADGDPASDVLLGENVFYPYSPPVSQALQHTLTAETAAASRAHFPIKVALIASPVDLGVIPDLFDQPQRYANFLDQEISFQTKQPLLVVMPSGYGVRGLPRPAAIAAESLTKPTGRQSNDLARAAILAVPKLAAAAGHPIRNVTDAPHTGAADNDTMLIAAILALGALATAGTLITVRLRRGTTHRSSRDPNPSRSPAASPARRRPRR
jgi:hypothetical protein